MHRTMLSLTLALATFVLLAGINSVVAQGFLPRPQTWVDGELFDGVVTPATFDPASDPFDQVYAGGEWLQRRSSPYFRV